MTEDFQKFTSLLINLRKENFGDLEFCIKNYLHRNLTKTELIQLINSFGCGADLSEDFFDEMFSDPNYFVSADNSDVLTSSFPIFRKRSIPESSYFSFLENNNIQVTWMEEYGFMEVSNGNYVSKTLQPLYLDNNEETQNVTENVFIVALPKEVADKFFELYQVTSSLDGGFVFSGEFKIIESSNEISEFDQFTVISPIIL